ncbi:MAG: hypothetical protein U1E87_05455 [Alphaproteobacteria bacterium]
MAVEPEREGQEDFLIRAVFAEGRLWVLSDAGIISSIAEGGDHWTREPALGAAMDLCVQSGRLLVAVGESDGANEWKLEEHESGAWKDRAVIERRNDALLAIDCSVDHVTLLTSRRLIDLKSGSDYQRMVALKSKLGRGIVGAVLGTPQELYVGFNAGEWGGGLQRIDRRDGTIETIERNTSGELCGGPLNVSCDPVTGIAAIPWKSGCIAVSIGLVHFLPHGGIVEVCGDKVKVLYSKPFIEEGTFCGQAKPDDPICTVAFFGLARAGESLWAAGIDGIYELRNGGSERVVPLPDFKKIDGIYVSFDLPNITLVLTSVNRRRSVSGAVPILVPH